jgi:hypothetical protein
MSESRLAIEPERLDELPLVLGRLERMGVAQAIDAHLGAGHGNRQGLSYGQLALGMSARIITLQAHRLAHMRREKHPGEILVRNTTAPLGGGYICARMILHEQSTPACAVFPAASTTARDFFLIADGSALKLFKGVTVLRGLEYH